MSGRKILKSQQNERKDEQLKNNLFATDTITQCNCDQFMPKTFKKSANKDKAGKRTCRRTKWKINEASVDLHRNENSYLASYGCFKKSMLLQNSINACQGSRDCLTRATNPENAINFSATITPQSPAGSVDSSSNSAAVNSISTSRISSRLWPQAMVTGATAASANFKGHRGNMTSGPSNCSTFYTAFTLLHRLLLPVVWQVMASSVIALLATLCYCLAAAQGVKATAAATTLPAVRLDLFAVVPQATSTTPLIAHSLTLDSHLAFDDAKGVVTRRSNRNGNSSRLNGKGSSSSSQTLITSNPFINSSSDNEEEGGLDRDQNNINIPIWTSHINMMTTTMTTTEMTILNDVSALLSTASANSPSLTSPSSSSSMATSGLQLTTQHHHHQSPADDVLLLRPQNDSSSRNISQTAADADGDVTFDDISAEDASEYIFDRTDVRIIFITLYTMVFCCCFFGNLLVILVVTLSRRLRSITNFFLANLALADFCVGLFCVMQNLSIYLIDSWVFGEFLCRMYQFVHSLSYTASIFILVVICMERYFAIVHPITCKQILTAARLRMVILTVWITSAVYSTPKFVFSKTIKNVHTESGREEEICVLDRKMFNSKLLDMINFGLLYCIPLLVMTVLYSKIAIALWRSSRGLTHHLAQHQDNSMGLHNSMYHHQHHHHHQHNHVHNNHHLHSNHQLQQSSTSQPNPGLGTPLSVGSGASSTLSRKESSKYEKRGINVTESQNDNLQVSLDDDRPVVSACRKTSFFQHHNHLTHQQQQQQQNQQSGQTTGNHQQRSHLHHNHGSHHGMHGSQRVSHFSHSSNNVLRARRGVVRMLIIFVLTFALCNLPYHARKMWQYWSRSYRGDSNFNALLTPLTFLVTYFNSGINPLLYAFLSRNFRKGMKELLMCSWRKSKTKSSTNSSMHHKRLALQTHSLPTDTTHIGNEQL